MNISEERHVLAANNAAHTGRILATFLIVFIREV